MDIENKLKPTRMEPGSDLHLTMLMAKYSLNHVTGEDRQALLAWGRDVWQAAKEQAAHEWWALVMCAAAELEDASIGMTDKDAKSAAEGAAKHYRARANELFAAAPEVVDPTSDQPSR